MPLMHIIILYTTYYYYIVANGGTLVASWPVRLYALVLLRAVGYPRSRRRAGASVTRSDWPGVGAVGKLWSAPTARAPEGGEGWKIRAGNKRWPSTDIVLHFSQFLHFRCLFHSELFSYISSNDLCIKIVFCCFWNNQPSPDHTFCWWMNTHDN